MRRDDQSFSMFEDRGPMIGDVAGRGKMDMETVKKAPGYMQIIGALMDKLECGKLCLRNVPILHNGGRHSVLVRDLTCDTALGMIIRSVVEKFNRKKDLDITISRDDISVKERFNYSYIVVVRHGAVKSELP